MGHDVGLRLAIPRAMRTTGPVRRAKPHIGAFTMTVWTVTVLARLRQTVKSTRIPGSSSFAEVRLAYLDLGAW